MDKAPDAYRTISEVADDLDIAQHVLRFWETKFPQIKPLKRGGGRRYYRPDDVELVTGIRHLLYKEGYTIKGVQRILKEQGPRAVMAFAAPPVAEQSLPPPPSLPAQPSALPPQAQAPVVPVRQMAARFQEPDPVPYHQEPIRLSEPPASLPAPAHRETLFDLPEIRRASGHDRFSEGVPGAGAGDLKSPEPVREQKPVSPQQVSMVRGGLTNIGAAALPTQNPGISREAQADIRPDQTDMSAQSSGHNEQSTLADALEELEAIRAGLAALLEQRPRQFA